eukprot:11218105-Lingulodinium_polyedra.AAC.2
MAGSVARVAPLARGLPAKNVKQNTDMVWTWTERGGAEAGTCTHCAKGPFRHARASVSWVASACHDSVGAVYAFCRSPWWPSPNAYVSVGTV